MEYSYDVTSVVHRITKISSVKHNLFGAYDDMKVQKFAMCLSATLHVDQNVKLLYTSWHQFLVF